MDVDQMMQGVREALTVRRVFGDPVERGETTVIPVARVMGGSGGGSGGDAAGDHGGGGGFGLRVRPAGVYVIEHGTVRWVPAVDPARAILALGLAVAAVLVGAGRVARVRQTRAEQVTRALRTR